MVAWVEPGAVKELGAWAHRSVPERLSACCGFVSSATISVHRSAYLQRVQGVGSVEVSPTAETATYNSPRGGFYRRASSAHPRRREPSPRITLVLGTNWAPQVKPSPPNPPPACRNTPVHTRMTFQNMTSVGDIWWGAGVRFWYGHLVYLDPTPHARA